MFITAASSICYQPAFNNPGFSSTMAPLNNSSQLLVPDYNNYIPPMERRRMSDILKMSITCAKNCLEQMEIEQPDAVIVGTALGCNFNTKTFLDKIRHSDGGLISPTAFTLSTHNTVAGQISVLLKNHAYNMTHTQKSLSFEHALIDGMMCIREGISHALVGGADERTDELYNIEAAIGSNIEHKTHGSSYFIISAQEPIVKHVILRNADVFSLTNDIRSNVLNFIQAIPITIPEIDLVLFSATSTESYETINSLFGQQPLIDYQRYSGTYYTNSAFALHMATDILLHSGSSQFGQPKNALICNNLVPGSLGLTYINLGNS